MTEPKIIIDNLEQGGFHNANPETLARLEKSKSYQDLSTICVIPTRGMVHARVVQSWMNLMAPMNQKFFRMFIIGMEVGAAYNTAVETIFANPGLADFKYMLTLEEDNMPPPDGLLKAFEHIGEYDVVGGLYWTKGEGGQPMIYGDPNVMPKNFSPQMPIPDSIQRANGLGMGFNLFKLDMFRDERLPKPWFKTAQEYTPSGGAKVYTQDLYFYENAGALGYKFACDTRIKVGHFDSANDFVW